MPHKPIDEAPALRLPPEPSDEGFAIARGSYDNLPVQGVHAREALRDEQVATIAHDLKTPLAIIMLETSLLDERLGGNAASRAGIDRIARNATYIDRLVSELLDLTSLDQGKLELRLERTDLARLLGDALARAVSSVDLARVALEIRDVVHARVDAGRIERVVSNLVSNALKYGPGAPVTVRLESRGSYSCVSVIDAGPGLSPDQARAVFERYRRGTSNVEGYGLGLYISRKIVETHGGRIGVASTPGKGSRFFFELPLVA